MIVRATSDLHLKPSTASYVFAALEELRLDAEKHEGITVLVGDILDQPNTVHMPTFNRLRGFLQRFKGKVYVVAGNHDQYDGTRNALEALEGGNVEVVSEPTCTSIGFILPYLPADKFWGAVKSLKDKSGIEAKVWWTHQGWKGSYLNNMRRDRDGLSPKKAAKVLVVSGHYHMPQNLGRIIYCGSPYETSFAEEGQKKGWLRWENFDASSPKLPKRVAFTFASPKHHTVVWDLKEKVKKPKGLKKGDKVRVLVEGTRAEAKEKASELKKAGLGGAAIVAKKASGSQRQVIDRNTSIQEAVNQFIQRVHGPDPKKIEPIRLFEWAREAEIWQS